jgi:Heterokaryon incompatibility protein (HET)
LIDVGEKDGPLALRLHETKLGESGQYIALSHPWGDPAQHPPFRSLRSNIESFKREIVFADLPMTFQDAVKTTRALGIRYLWIDSICIIQGRDGDFNTEAGRMEDVFSSAYCVIAASRAKGQCDGFLKKRPQRQFLTFQRGKEEPFYVCEAIDDFNRDVLDGSLNKRGWVLQERALAHRTVFFTESQTYWECGGGVRCETLTKMHK